jgi:hypothetical protein
VGQAAVRGALYLHRPTTAATATSLRGPKRTQRDSGSGEAHTVAAALDTVLLQLVELDLATVRLTAQLPGASTTTGGDTVVGLATQLVSWGAAAAEGEARLIELNLATERPPAQSAMLGLDADDGSLQGAVLLLRAKGGLWAAHAALVAMAPTLVWLAAEAGAVAVSEWNWLHDELRSPLVMMMKADGGGAVWLWRGWSGGIRMAGRASAAAAATPQP